MSSACGMCGRLTIESLRADAPVIRTAWRVSAATLIAIPDRLRAAQPVFDETGALKDAKVEDQLRQFLKGFSAFAAAKG